VLDGLLKLQAKITEQHARGQRPVPELRPAMQRPEFEP
jgi:hypothetical protein